MNSNAVANHVDHYFMTKLFRWFFTALFITLGIFLVFVGIYTGSVFVIVFEILFCLLALPFVIYVVAYRKIRVTHEGLLYSQIINPFKPLLIRWEDIKRISTAYGYHVVNADGVFLASFTDRIEKFDSLLASFHSKNISIDKKTLKIPQPDPSLEDSGFLTSSSNPPRLYQHKGVVLGLLAIALLVSLELAFFVLCFVAFGAINAILSIVWLIMTFWFLDLVLNGFVRIRLEGLDIPVMFGKREIILWTEIPYAKYFESTIGTKTFRVLKLFAHNKNDFVGYVVQDSPAWEPLLRELKSLSIPIITETELFNPRNPENFQAAFSVHDSL